MNLDFFEEPIAGAYFFIGSSDRLAPSRRRGHQEQQQVRSVDNYVMEGFVYIFKTANGLFIRIQ